MRVMDLGKLSGISATGRSAFGATCSSAWARYCLRWFLVPRAGIEPALPKEQDFESSASTSSATGAS